MSEQFLGHWYFDLETLPVIWFNHKMNLIILDGMMKNCIKSPDVLSQQNGNMLFTMSGFPLCLDNNI